jgi:hypothetical protein
MDPIRVEDSFGEPVEFKAYWEFSGHEARSDAEKNQLAEGALVAEGHRYVEKRRAAGKQIAFDHVQIVRHESQGSKTKKSWDGTRTHKCWGTVFGYVFVTAM